jgi:hypothetical protein
VRLTARHCVYAAVGSLAVMVASEALWSRLFKTRANELLAVETPDGPPACVYDCTLPTYFQMLQAVTLGALLLALIFGGLAIWKMRK